MTKYTFSIDLSKVDKLKLKKTDKGQIFGNFEFIMRDELDQYGNCGFIVQQSTAEERQQQVKLPILGNAKLLQKKVQQNIPPKHQSEFNPLPSAPPYNEEKYYMKDPSEFKNDLPF